MPGILSKEQIDDIVAEGEIPGMRRDVIEEIPWLCDFLESVQDDTEVKVSAETLQNITEKKEATGNVRSWRNNVSCHVTQFITFVINYCLPSIFLCFIINSLQMMEFTMCLNFL